MIATTEKRHTAAGVKAALTFLGHTSLPFVLQSAPRAESFTAEEMSFAEYLATDNDFGGAWNDGEQIEMHCSGIPEGFWKTDPKFLPASPDELARLRSVTDAIERTFLAAPLVNHNYKAHVQKCRKVLASHPDSGKVRRWLGFSVGFNQTPA